MRLLPSKAKRTWRWLREGEGVAVGSRSADFPDFTSGVVRSTRALRVASPSALVASRLYIFFFCFLRVLRLTLPLPLLLGGTVDSPPPPSPTLP